MKTYTKQVTENTTVIGGIDHNGIKGDLLEVKEVNHPWGETVGQIYFLTESTSDELPIKTFPSVEEAVSACRSEIRKIKMTMGNLDIKKMILDL